MKNLTTTEVAERLNVGRSTVTLWCRQKRFPNAYPEDTPRGVIWWIPEKDLAKFEIPKPGRPQKPESELKHKRRKSPAEPQAKKSRKVQSN